MSNAVSDTGMVLPWLAFARPATRVRWAGSLLLLAAGLAGCNDQIPTQPAVDRETANARIVPYTWTVVSGFNSPRGLAFGPDGLLYVAEAGTGGTMSTAGQCAQEPAPVGPWTGGLTARVSRVSRAGARETFASGLPSAVGPDGTAIGVADLAFLGDQLYALVGGGGCSRGQLSLPSGIYQIASNGSWNPVANFTTFYQATPAANPDILTFSPDGSLYSLEAAKGRLYFTEANQKGLFEWAPSTGFSRVADLSLVSGLEVPAALSAHGPILVGDFGVLRGPTIGSGTESIYQVTPSGSTRVWASGFTKILGLVVHRGSLYVLESVTGSVFAPFTGRVVRIGGMARAPASEVVVSGLYFPTAIAIGPDNALYVTNRGFGAAPGSGEVLRVPL
jgi:hypothetical protein